MLLGCSRGLLVGLLPASPAAGAHATARFGGDLTQIDLLTYPRLVLAGSRGEIGQAAGLITFGVVAICLVAGTMLMHRPQPTAYGSAQWAVCGELHRAGLLARRLEAARGQVWARQIFHSLVTAPSSFVSSFGTNSTHSRRRSGASGHHAN